MSANALRRTGILMLALVLVISMFAGCNQSKPSESTPSESAPSGDPPADTQPTVMEGDEFSNGAIGQNGGISSCSVYSSQIGIDILKAGGNAVDAAVATIFAAGVVEPNLSGVGGCGMMNIYIKETGEFVLLEYMETVPAAVTPGWYNPETDGETAKNVAVPSQVHGLLTALDKYGTMSREQVMQPAIDLARNGWTLDKRLADAVSGSFEMIEANETAASIYLADGIPMNEGDLIKNEPLAVTLEAIRDGGIEEYYTGDLAKKIVDAMQADGSLISMEDMAGYETVEREPLTTTYYGYTVVVPPPPSNGGDWLLVLLNIIEELNITQYDVNSADYLKVFNEANRIGLVDSYSYIGDPAFYDLPMKELTSKEYAKERAALISMDQAMEVVPVSDLPITKLNPTGAESQHTSHTAVIDSHGNIVSATNTLGLGWGAKYTPADTGFFMNSHISNIEHDPEKSDSPDFVAPGKRVRSTITPSFVLKDGEPIMAIGSPGSLAIPPAVAMVINNVLFYDMNVQQAINLPRAMAINRSSAEGALRKLTIEQGRFDPEVVAALEAYGYEITPTKSDYDSAVGGIAAIYLDRETGTFYAGGDPRRNYKALAY